MLIVHFVASDCMTMYLFTGMLWVA